MAFEVFLIDTNGDYVSLDTEGIDLTAVFAVADITDIAARKGSMTKQVAFKGTKTNNHAFGNLFHLNRYVDTTNLTNVLFFNYSPLKEVPCIVYEDSHIVLKGSLRVIEGTIINKVYHTIITDKLIDFKTAIAEKQISEIEFSDLRHHYTWSNIINSGTTSTERYDPVAGTFGTTPLLYGSGYVYPYIDYGVLYRNNTLPENADPTKHQVLNFRPAIYSKEIITRIFKDAGFTYELKGDNDLQARFNRLIVPNADDRLTGTHYGYYTQFKKSIVVIENQTNLAPYHSFIGVTYNESTLLNINSYVAPSSTQVTPYILHSSGGSGKVLDVKRNFKSDAKAVIHLDVFNNYNNQPFDLIFTVVERDARNDSSANESAGWEMNGLASKAFTIPAGSSISNQTITLNVAERDWLIGKQTAIMVFVNTPDLDYSGMFDYSITDAYINFPKDEYTKFYVDLELGDSSAADALTPTVPLNIKQSDFIKSVMAKFNLYAYVDPENEKNIIFEKYDDYYALTSPLYINSTALNWSKKVDLPSVKWKASLTLPKTYLFTDKDDSDRMSKFYKGRFNEVFGTYQATDALGVVESKKVETIFSSTPMFENIGNGRIHAALYEDNSGQKKPIKTNIRLLYYNGHFPCDSYSVLKDVYSGGWTTDVVAADMLSYPRATSYFFDTDGKPVESLYFGRPKEFYFNINQDYFDCDSAYEAFYRNQVTELTNPNLHTLECDVRLNEVDIANLDLKIPVFLDFGPHGYHYYKVLNVEYVPKKLSKVTLQKIILGAER